MQEIQMHSLTTVVWGEWGWFWRILYGSVCSMYVCVCVFMWWWLCVSGQKESWILRSFCFSWRVELDFRTQNQIQTAAGCQKRVGMKYVDSATLQMSSSLWRKWPLLPPSSWLLIPVCVLSLDCLLFWSRDCHLEQWFLKWSSADHQWLVFGQFVSHKRIRNKFKSLTNLMWSVLTWCFH